MPKIKTRKSVAKRFRVTASKKVMRRHSNQNHFNARENSDKKREKRTDQDVSKRISQNILIEMPYN